MAPLFSSPQSRLIIFVLDVSDSMSDVLNLMRFYVAKSLGEAYYRRDPVAIITVNGSKAEFLVYPTTSLHFILHRLATLKVGGGTPLDHGFALVARMMLQWYDRYPVIDLFVLSDGRSTGSLHGPGMERTMNTIRKFSRQVTVVNPMAEAEPFARELASLLGGKYYDVQIPNYS